MVFLFWRIVPAPPTINFSAIQNDKIKKLWWDQIRWILIIARGPM